MTQFQSVIHTLPATLPAEALNYWSLGFTVLLRYMVAQAILLPVGLWLIWKSGTFATTRVIEVCSRATEEILEGKEISVHGNALPAALQTRLAKLADIMSESRRKETSIFEKTADVICILDIQGKFVRVSAACENQWGYRQEELVDHDQRQLEMHGRQLKLPVFLM